MIRRNPFLAATVRGFTHFNVSNMAERVRGGLRYSHVGLFSAICDAMRQQSHALTLRQAPHFRREASPA
jgi:hypothetical protein